MRSAHVRPHTGTGDVAGPSPTHYPSPSRRRSGPAAPSDAQTDRLLRAIAHPSVDVLGHPTGRLIGRRRGAVFDLPTVCRAAADHGVMLEIDAQPERLDLDDVACRAAIEHGVRIVIDTDAHAVAELGLMRWGVSQARRGWAERRHVANTRPLAQLLKLLHRERG